MIIKGLAGQLMSARCITLGTRPYITLAKVAEVVGVEEYILLKRIFGADNVNVVMVRTGGVLMLEASSATMLILHTCSEETAKLWHAWVHEHRAKRKLTEYEKKIVAARQMWKCAMCEGVLTADYEVDHIEQQCIRHNNNAANLQALCPGCHRKKTREDRIFADPLLDTQGSNAFSQYFN